MAARREANIPGWDKPRDVRTPLEPAAQVFNLWDAKLETAKIAEGRENELADSLDGPLGAKAQHIPDVLWGLLLNMQPWVPFRGLK